MNKKICLLIFLLLFLILFPLITFAEEINNTSVYSYGGSKYDCFNKVTTTSDNGYIAVGSTSSYDIENIKQNGNKDALIVKYDSKNNVIWEKNYGSSRDDMFNDIIASKNGEYIAVGYKSISSRARYAVIVKYDSNGNLIWEKNYGGTKIDSFNSVALTSDNCYIAIGYINSKNIEGITYKGASEAIMIKYNSNGDIIWQKNYGGSANDYLHEIKVLPDDSYIVVGYSYSTDINGINYDVTKNKNSSDAIIVKYDKNGNIIWQRNYGGSASDVLYSVIQTLDGGFISVGYSYSKDLEGITNNGDFVGIIVRFDSQGNVKWQKGYGLRLGNCFKSVISTPENEYIAVGYANLVGIEGSNKQSGSDTDAIVIKYNEQGEIIKQDYYIGDSDDELNSITLSKNSGYIAVGYCSENIVGLTSYKGYIDGFIIRLDNSLNEFTIKQNNSILPFILIGLAFILVIIIIFVIIKKVKKNI